MKVYKIIILLLQFEINIIAQQYEVKLNSITNNDTVLSIAIQIKSDSKVESLLGNATIRFSYDQNKLIFPDQSIIGKDYNFICVNSKHYLCSVTKPSSNTISVNIYYRQDNPVIITEEFSEIARIKFKKKYKDANYKFDHFNAEIFSPNDSKPWNVVVNSE